MAGFQWISLAALLLCILVVPGESIVLNSSAEIATATIVGDYTGASASLNVWQPFVELVNEYSASQITITSVNSSNIIEIGWHVYPLLYDDNETHMFVRWQIVDDAGQRIGCFNTVCSGFVQVSTIAIAGNALTDTISQVNGTQYVTNIGIYKAASGDWWVTNSNESVGYFPANLLSDLQLGTSQIAWGGKILNKQNTTKRHTYTEMGSGFFPLSGYGFSAFHSNLSYTENRNVTLSIIGTVPDSLYMQDTGDCYYTYLEEPTGRLYFGGAGDNPRCQELNFTESVWL